MFQGVSLEKTFYIQVTIFLGDIDAKKDQKNPPKTSHKIFSQCLIVTSSFLWAFMVENVCKNSFLGGKNRKNGIPVLKITFSLHIIPQNYRFPWVTAKTVIFSWNFFIKTIIPFFSYGQLSLLPKFHFLSLKGNWV